MVQDKPARKQLLAWPLPGDCLHASTAQQCFQALAPDRNGCVSVKAVADAWPKPKGHDPQDKEVQYMLQRLASAHGQEGHLSWLEFCCAVRIWHATGGQPLGLRTFMQRAAAEASGLTMVALLSVQAASMACATMGEAAWAQVAALGGVGALISALPLDASAAHSRLQPADATAVAGSKAQRRLFIALGASLGALAAPAVPLLASTVGDPQTRGYGPLAVAGLVTVHLAGHTAALAVIPEAAISDWDPSPTVGCGASAFAAVSGGIFAAGLGLTAAKLSGRDGAVRPVLLAAGALSVHSAATTFVAFCRHCRGQPEPLQPALAPVLQLLGLLRRFIVIADPAK
mmetsp:Transcript_70354/g.139513  ORF Transcript_70354/g.139513 Transcript_70354/m.139513 type:complete len:343 (-) Transcript_70354:215-1243(-)|eukprot:CAMPEP_0172672038 /NCGR_PEP_ID=MMETSP1074-20121228/11301_1 /TAXON_ID=2916 /ORGANISM="Ceratium fusus, Strain PA161109" /LENGTH=342 /DNA_ID=CAMNT_0013489175 /DNA_START=103 /DNA_END=1131 /DNA_ORIENTATION=-